MKRSISRSTSAVVRRVSELSFLFSRNVSLASPAHGHRVGIGIGDVEVAVAVMVEGSGVLQYSEGLLVVKCV